LAHESSLLQIKQPTKSKGIARQRAPTRMGPATKR
jgi:hypothetical protein